jgi:hypothetical protein
MDPLTMWLETEAASTTVGHAREPPTMKPREAARVGLRGYAAQMQTVLTAFRLSAPGKKKKKKAPVSCFAPVASASGHERRANGMRAARDRAFGAKDPLEASEYSRAQEAMRYRALWFSDRASWLESQKRRWRALREKRKRRGEG